MKPNKTTNYPLQNKIIEVKGKPNKTAKDYARGSYNKFNDTEQWIRISEGCPNNCEFCRETKECGTEEIYFEIPEIVRNKVKIMDMNLIYKSRAYDIINQLGSKRVDGKFVYYELICGIDYRFMFIGLANALKMNRFVNIRLAWDHSLQEQIKIKSTINDLFDAGYKSKDISCFIICDWKITFKDCCRKLDLLKIWGVKVNDCWFNNTTSPNFQQNYWTLEDCKTFRSMCRKHNQMILFGIDPELKTSQKGE